MRNAMLIFRDVIERTPCGGCHPDSVQRSFARLSQTLPCQNYGGSKTLEFLLAAELLTGELLGSWGIGMNLNEYSAKKRREILDDLLAEREPSEGEWSREVLAEARKIGRPKMGPILYEPWAMSLQFPFAGQGTEAIVFTVRLNAPHRIVHLPVPSWVVENVWQGDVAGSFHFEPDALALVEEFRAELSEERNPAFFAARMKQGREGAF